jgi:hypothetical protein
VVADEKRALTPTSRKAGDMSMKNSEILYRPKLNALTQVDDPIDETEEFRSEVKKS